MVSTSAFTEHYLVNLLAACLHAENLPAPEPGYDETPLALLYVRALQATHLERARLLRAMGDMALFVSGFFSDSLDRRLVGLDYYRAMGGRAYSRLSQQADPFGFGPAVYSELCGSCSSSTSSPRCRRAAGSRATSRFSASTSAGCRRIVAFVYMIIDELHGTALTMDLQALSPSHLRKVIAKRDRFDHGIRRVIQEGIEGGALTPRPDDCRLRLTH